MGLYFIDFELEGRSVIYLDSLVEEFVYLKKIRGISRAISAADFFHASGNKDVDIGDSYKPLILCSLRGLKYCLLSLLSIFSTDE